MPPIDRYLMLEARVLFHLPDPICSTTILDFLKQSITCNASPVVNFRPELALAVMYVNLPYYIAQLIRGGL